MITTIHFSIYGKMLFKNNISEIKLKQIGLNISEQLYKLTFKHQSSIELTNKSNLLQININRNVS